MAAHYVYRAFDADGRLLYVGCSKNPAMRWKQHMFEHTWWAERAVRFNAKVYPSRSQALEAEREAIRSEQPIHNWQHRWPTHASWERHHFIEYVTALLEVPYGNDDYRRSHVAKACGYFEGKYGENLRLVVGRVPVGRRRSAEDERKPKWRTA